MPDVDPAIFLLPPQPAVVVCLFPSRYPLTQTHVHHSGRTPREKLLFPPHLSIAAALGVPPFTIVAIASVRPPPSAMPGLVTATGVLGFLADEEPELKVFALQTLNDDIDTVWTEVAGVLSQL